MRLLAHLVVVVIVSANWTTGLLTIAVLRGTGGLAILLARTTLILRLDNDHLKSIQSENKHISAVTSANI